MRLEGGFQGAQQARLVVLDREQEVGAAPRNRRRHGRRGAGRIDRDDPAGQPEVLEQRRDGRPLGARPGLDHADHRRATQGLDEMVHPAVAGGAARPLAIDVHRLAGGLDPGKDIVEVVGLGRAPQRVGAGRPVP